MKKRTDTKNKAKGMIMSDNLRKGKCAIMENEQFDLAQKNISYFR